MSDSPKNLKFRTLRPVRIASLTGHVVEINPDEPVELPPELHPDAFAAGCVPVDSDEQLDEDSIVEGQAPQGEARERAIIDAIHLLITEGDERDFRKTDGVPKVASVEAKFGYAVTGAEIEAAFEKVKAIAASLKTDSEE